ncbi:MAG: hypothetical protein DLM69_12430 [Candidatus Chloroheliales bacterium]|nr:MAG: hypothetical protein DLM69_12430 [Chloroflexota bacterium]
MRSLSSTLSVNGLWYVLVGLFLMFVPNIFAAPLGLTQPPLNFYNALGAAGMIGLGVAAAGLARNFTPAGVGGVILANFIVLITMLYWLLLVKNTGATSTGNIVLWIAFALLLIITLAEIAFLNNRRWRSR